ncbi:MAG: cupin domain-containing protein [Actinomycetota bacterium]|nr:cupin domain-containing protein [Actinomycetota bacterium]
MADQSVIGPLVGRRLGGPDSDFAIVEWIDSGESDWEWIAPLHVHHGDDEAWYVLAGALRVRIGNETFQAGPGGAAFAPKGTPHAYGNARREPVRYLLVTTPKLLALVDALHAPGAGDYAAIFRAHDSELLS